LTGQLLTPNLECDAEVSLDELTQDFFDWITRCGPFGIGNREPIFVSREVTLTAEVRLIKERHICLQVQQEGKTQRFSALGWSRTVNWPMRCEELALGLGSRIDVAYRLKTKANPQFPGLELELIDLRLAASPTGHLSGA
jgi:single-stranded-DNA-specific exonuclease